MALALLESLRSTDTPAETLVDEDLPRSLPRRLGLSNVVEAQIRRYRDLADRNGSLDGEEMRNLYSLVGRRPDSRAVFAAAGRWLTDRGFESRRLSLATVPLPRSLRRRLALRQARKVARLVSPPARPRTESGPPALVVEGCLPAFATEASAGCELVLSAFHGILERYGERDPEVVHPLCEALGDSCCLWRLGG